MGSTILMWSPPYSATLHVVQSPPTSSIVESTALNITLRKAAVFHMARRWLRRGPELFCGIVPVLIAASLLQCSARASRTSAVVGKGKPKFFSTFFSVLLASGKLLGV